MAIQIYDSLSQKKLPFVPLKEGQVTMYVCGPTVYGLLHVGNFRGPIFFNLVRNWFEHEGYKVDFAYNFTDVDDKIINRANAEGVEPQALAEKYIVEFMKDFTTLGLRTHTRNPKVTETMGPIVELVADLIKKEKAYVAADGEVLYSVRSFAGYGKLTHKNIDDLQSGARIEVDPKKRDPLDFALWKPAKPGEPKWPSPWSDGRPGWHIECSAMVHSIYGDTIDIHGGGTDLMFPHHENEIAQSEGSSAQPLAHYWMHNAMLTFGEKKMSKSLGNIIPAREFLAKYDGEILKFMMLSVHYRSMSDFSEHGIQTAISGLAKIYSALNLAEKTIAAGAGVTAAGTNTFGKVIADAQTEVSRALSDDFNTPELFAAMYGVIRALNTAVRPGAKVTPEILKTALQFKEWVLSVGALMSLFQQTPGVYLHALDDRLLADKGVERTNIDSLVAERTEARNAKNFKRSDEIRDQLASLGIALHDAAGGTSWEVAK